MDYDVTRRQRTLRIVLFGIILMTLPFYFIGFLLWGTAGMKTNTVQSLTTVTYTPIGGGLVLASSTPTVTANPRTPTSQSPLQPTPLQFFPPAFTNAPIATGVIIPVDTLAPTLTLIPSFTPLPSTTPFVPTSAPTLTPLPTDVPTVAPPPTDPPTAEPLPTDPPLPTDAPPPTAEGG